MILRIFLRKRSCHHSSPYRLTSTDVEANKSKAEMKKRLCKMYCCQGDVEELIVYDSYAALLESSQN